MNCPWCGKEVTTETYTDHYDICPKRPRKEAVPLTEVSAFYKRKRSTRVDRLGGENISRMLNQLPLGFYYDSEAKIFSAAMFSAKTTLAKGGPRRVFVQDFAAALNRRGLLPNERVEVFTESGYAYMKNPEAIPLTEARKKVGKPSFDEIRRKVDEYLELSKQMTRYADVGDWKQYQDLRVKRREITYWLIDIDFLKETFLLI